MVQENKRSDRATFGVRQNSSDDEIAATLFPWNENMRSRGINKDNDHESNYITWHGMASHRMGNGCIVRVKYDHLPGIICSNAALPSELDAAEATGFKTVSITFT